VAGTGNVLRDVLALLADVKKDELGIVEVLGQPLRGNDEVLARARSGGASEAGCTGQRHDRRDGGCKADEHWNVSSGGGCRGCDGGM
jgi:hypothetical protein